MSRKPTEKEEEALSNIQKGGIAAGGVGALGTYVTAARNNQLEQAAKKMTNEYGSRLNKELRHRAGLFKGDEDTKLDKQRQREAFKRSGRWPTYLQSGQTKGGRKYKKGEPVPVQSNAFRKAFGRFRAEFYTKKGDVKKFHQSGHERRKYTRYAQKIAKLTGTKFDTEYTKEVDAKGGIIKKQGRDKGRAFRKKGLAGLISLIPLAHRARLPGFNLIGKLGYKKQAYKPRSSSGKTKGRLTVGGLRDREAKAPADRYYPNERDHPSFGKKTKGKSKYQKQYEAWLEKQGE